MRRLRLVLCWYYALDSLASLQTASRDILRAAHGQDGTYSLSYLPGALVFSLAAIISGMAWWTVWKQKASGRGWALAISIWNLLLGTPLFYYWLYGWSGYWQLFRNWLWFPTVVGVVGLVAFLRPYGPPQPAAKKHYNTPIPGDGTNEFVSTHILILVFAMYCLAVFPLFDGWIKTKGIPRDSTSWLPAVMLVQLMIIASHELGHTLTGVVLGMKVRAFCAGPLQWRIRDGKWEFQFKPKEILLGGGATAR